MVWTKADKSGRQSGMGMLLAALTLTAIPDTAFGAGIASVQSDDHHIRIQFDGAVRAASSFELQGPYRIALDVDGVEKGMDVGTASGPVSAIRQAQFSPETTRIVFDLARPAYISNGRFSADGRTLVLDLAPATQNSFDAAVQRPRKTFAPPPAFRATPPRSKYSITVPLPAPTNGLPRPRIYGPAGRPLVVIDAGHGGHDPGSISPVNSTREKDVTLAIAQQIKNALVAGGRVRVALVREDDRFFALRERIAIARSVNADLFISVHADSAGTGVSEASGATVYTLSEVASDREAQALAARENKADIINGVNLSNENKDIANILVDLAQRETMNASAGFAKLLRREAANLIPFRTGFHHMAGFAVLKAPDTPAILLETGYLTSAADVRRLTSSEGQSAIAQGVRRAVEIFFAKRLAQR